MTEEQANLVYHGPAATHEVVCPVLGCTNSAVLEFGSPGIFQPCWACQERGYVTKRPRRRWWRRRQ
jgi:hypothetical protein